MVPAKHLVCSLTHSARRQRYQEGCSVELRLVLKLPIGRRMDDRLSDGLEPGAAICSSRQ